jgi:hypothetical protein
MLASSKDMPELLKALAPLNIPSHLCISCQHVFHSALAEREERTKG